MVANFTYFIMFNLSFFNVFFFLLSSSFYSSLFNFLESSLLVLVFGWLTRNLLPCLYLDISFEGLFRSLFSSGKVIMAIFHIAFSELLSRQTRIWRSYNYFIGMMVRVFTNGPGDWGSITDQFIPKTQKNGTWCLLA